MRYILPPAAFVLAFAAAICVADDRCFATVTTHAGTPSSHFDVAPPRFDLVLLGLGEDGHTASLLPGTEVLDEWCRWVCEVYVAEQDLYRVTATALLINQAALVAFLVAGKGKAAILRKALEGSHDPKRLPARMIKPGEGRLLWLADRDAAGLLHEKLLRSDHFRGQIPVSSPWSRYCAKRRCTQSNGEPLDPGGNSRQRDSA